MNRNEVCASNSAFWHELCGSIDAERLGIWDNSPESLKKFDDWYFAYYPYLERHLPLGELAGKNVLEVGLGYGTVAQRLAAWGANYRGLDIAAGPVAMTNHRIQQAGLSGQATHGSILAPPFAPESFDTVVAIGSLHHTGDLQLAIRRCRELLRPGGKLIFMVYYAYSYRRFRMAPVATIKYMAKELAGYRGVVGNSDVRERAAYDTSPSGAGAPHTDWVSVRSLRALCGEFAGFEARLENIDQEFPFRWASRDKLLETRWPQRVGLDLYATATK